MSCAMVGKLFLDVCFTTIYVALGEIFQGSAQEELAVMACETTARTGGIVAPMCGMLSTKVSCPLFAATCVAATCSTLTLPERRPKRSQ